MFTDEQTREVKITDESVLKSIKTLLNGRGYNIIGRNGDTVYFETWGLGEQRRGIALTLNETSVPNIQYLIEYEPLSVAGYYYYRADYEEYRNR